MNLMFHVGHGYGVCKIFVILVTGYQCYFILRGIIIVLTPGFNNTFSHQVIKIVHSLNAAAIKYRFLHHKLS